jgi:hypothetical protein
MSVKLNSSGGGSVTLQEPTTASDFTLTLPAATGTVLTTAGISTPVEFPAGSVSAPSITTTGDTNTGIFFPAADTIAFAEGGVEAMRIDSSARIGFGVTPSVWSGVIPWSMDLPYSGFVANNSSDKAAYLGTNMYYDGTNWRAKTTGASSIYAAAAGSHLWFVGSSVSADAVTTLTEQVRINSSGQFLINQTSGNNGRFSVFTSTVGDNLIEARSTASGMTHLLVNTTLSSAGGSDALGVYDASGISARISTNGFYQSRPNSYGSTSDERLKENIVDATPKLADLMQVQVRNFNYKDQPGEKQIGVIAQELESIFPGLVHEVPNALPELADEPTVKSVKYSVFVPMLIKAIQELKAELDATKAEVAALKGAV